MLLNKSFKYLSPTKELRELYLLVAVESFSAISQSEMAKYAGISSSMVNSYIKEFQKKGYIEVKGETNRSIRYYLTHKGKEHKNKLLIDFAVEIIQTYTSVKMEFIKRLEEFYKQGLKKAVLYGASETGEVVLAAAKDSPVRIVDIVDSDVKKHGKMFHGYKILSPALLSELDVDGVIITSFGKQEEIYQSIKYLEERGWIIARL